MGAHRTMDDRTTDIARVVGRGALATSVTLALAGSGAGLAAASPGEHGHGGYDGLGGHSGHGSHEDHGDERSVSSSSSSSVDCEALDDDLVDGLLGGLGLSGSSEQRCTTGSGTASSTDETSDDASGTGGGSATSATSGTTSTAPSASSSGSSGSSGGDSATRRAAAPRPQTAPANSVDEPAAPGETKIIDLPDEPGA